MRLWRVDTRRCIRVFNGHSRPVLSCAASVDGRFAASASSDTTAIVWDVATGTALRTLYGARARRRCHPRRRRVPRDTSRECL